MILIADGGSTKADWIALDEQKKELFKVRTGGLNPAVVAVEVLRARILETAEFSENLDKVTQVFFYGAGCGTQVATKILKDLFEELFQMPRFLWAKIHLLLCMQPREKHLRLFVF